MLEKNRSVKLSLIAIVIVVLITIVPTGVIIGFAKYDKWRVAKVISETINLREEGDLTTAFQKIRNLSLDYPSDIQVLRELARTYLAYWKINKEVRLAEGVFHAWDSIEKSAMMTPADRREFATAFMEMGNLSVAKKIISNARDKNSIENILLDHRISYLMRNFSEAKRLSEHAYSLDPDNSEIKLNYAKSMLEGNLPGALEILDELRDGGDEVAAKALCMICSAPSFSRGIRMTAALQLVEQPGLDISFYLIAIEAMMSLSPQDYEELLQETVDRFSNSIPKDMLVVGRWLNKKKAFSHTLSLVDEVSAFDRMDIFLVRADALAEEDKWSEVERLMNDYRVPLKDFHRKIFLGVAVAAQDRLKEAVAIWNQTLSPGADINYRMSFLVQHVLRRGYYEYAEQVFRKMSQNPITRKAGYDGLIDISRRLNKPQGILDTLHEMKGHYLMDNEIIREISYYNILTGNNLASATNKAYELYRSNKKSLVFRLVLSFALLKNDNYSTAFELLDIKDLDWNRCKPYARLIKAVTLIMNDQTDAGIKLFDTIKEGEIMDLEKEFFYSYLNK